MKHRIWSSSNDMTENEPRSMPRKFCEMILGGEDRGFELRWNKADFWSGEATTLFVMLQSTRAMEASVAVTKAAGVSVVY